MKTCPRCHYENNDSANFCVKCGSSLKKQCPRCGASVSDEALFCSVCGLRLDGSKPCPRCGKSNRPGSLYCEMCGAPLSAPAAFPQSPAFPACPSANQTPAAAPAGGRQVQWEDDLWDGAPSATGGSAVPPPPAFGQTPGTPGISGTPGTPASPGTPGMPGTPGAPSGQAPGQNGQFPVFRQPPEYRPAFRPTPAPMPGPMPVYPPGSAMAHAARRKEIPPKTLQLISVIRAAVILAMAVLMFLFSFFGLAKIYGVPIRETQFNLSSYTNKAEEVTAFDLLEGAAAWNNPMTEEELREDLSRFIEETRGADAADRFFSQNGSLSEKAEIVKEYNLFKATASDRNAYYNSSVCAELILFSVSSLLCILASAGFAAAATVRLIFLLKGKKDLKSPLWLNFLALGCMLFTLFGMSSFFGASWAGAAAPAIALIVAGIFSLAAEITWSFLSEKHPVSRVRVGAIVASSIGVLLIAAAGASAIRMGYFLPYSNDAGYGLGSLVRAFDMLRRATDDPDLLGSLKSLLDEAIHGSLLDPSEIYFLLDPANMGVYGYYSVEQGFAVLGVITGTAFLLTLISALVSGADALSALVRGRRQKLAPAIVTAILGCTLLGLSIGFTALTNQITQSDVVYYGTSVSASTVLAALLSVANLVQCIVFRLSGKKKKKTETKQTAPSVR